MKSEIKINSVVLGLIILLCFWLNWTPIAIGLIWFIIFIATLAYSGIMVYLYTDKLPKLKTKPYTFMVLSELILFGVIGCVAYIHGYVVTGLSVWIMLLFTIVVIRPIIYRG